MEDCVGHHCGLFGAHNLPKAARHVYDGLFALQHRGQEAAGIATSNGKQAFLKKGMGLVTEVFTPKDLDDLDGHLAIGHTRYSTTGSSRAQNAQPMLVEFSDGGALAVAHNGNLVNARLLRKELEKKGAIFQTTTDSEVILHLLAKAGRGQDDNGIISCLRQVKGAFSFLIMTKDRLIGARDPNGFRPLILGRMRREDGLPGEIGERHILCSETCALDQVGAELIREIEPGEMVIIDNEGVRFITYVENYTQPSHCMFEHVYFARPDSMIFGDDVHQLRIKLGRQLAREHPVEADVVFSVPDSGNSGAIGYSRESGILLDMGFIRNHYVGRSFIKPNQTDRENTVRMKFNVVRSTVQGKRVIVVEDSLVRGTTFKKQAGILRQAGAKEVHLRITCPPTLYGCYYGIDFPSRDVLIAARLKNNVKAIADYLGVDSLGYLSVDGLLSAAGKPKNHYCTACWTGQYPVQPVDDMDKYAMETGIKKICGAEENPRQATQ